MPVLNKTPSQRAVLPYVPHGGWHSTVLHEPKVPPQAQQAKKPSGRHQPVPSVPVSKPSAATPSVVPQKATNVPQEQLDSVRILDEGSADRPASGEAGIDDKGSADRAASGGVQLDDEGFKLTELWRLIKIITSDIDPTVLTKARALQQSNPEEFEKLYYFFKNYDIETARKVNWLKKTNVQTWADKNLTPEVAELVSNWFFSDKPPLKKAFLVEVLTVAAALKKCGLARLCASDLNGCEDIPLHSHDLRNGKQRQFRNQAKFGNQKDMVVAHIVGLGLIVEWNLDLPKQRMNIKCLSEILNDWKNMRMETKTANGFHETLDKILRKPGAAELTGDQLNRLKEIIAVIQADWFQKAMIKGGGLYLYDRIRQNLKKTIYPYRHSTERPVWEDEIDIKGLKPADLVVNDRWISLQKKRADSNWYFEAADFKYADNRYGANPDFLSREMKLFVHLEPERAARLKRLTLHELKELVIKHVGDPSVLGDVLNRQDRSQDRRVHLQEMVIVALARCEYGDHMELADVSFEYDHQRLVSLDLLVKLNVQVDKKASCQWIRRIVTHEKNALPAQAPKPATDNVKAALLRIAGNTGHDYTPPSVQRRTSERSLLVLMARFLQSQDGGDDILFAAEIILDRHVNGSVWRTAKEGKQLGGAAIYTGPRGGKFVIAGRLSTIYVSGPRRQDGYPDMRFKMNKSKVAKANEFSPMVPVGPPCVKQRINSEKAIR